MRDNTTASSLSSIYWSCLSVKWSCFLFLLTLLFLSGDARSYINYYVEYNNYKCWFCGKWNLFKPLMLGISYMSEESHIESLKRRTMVYKSSWLFLLLSIVLGWNRTWACYHESWLKWALYLNLPNKWYHSQWCVLGSPPTPNMNFSEDAYWK